jgi:uncharacterized protein YggT (Ycf19 family)
MLTSILNFLFNAILFLLGLASWVVLIYVLMALFIPQHRYTLMARRYVEPVLSPIRHLLLRVFPKLSQLGVDFSPLAFYLLIQIASWLIRLLRSVLL